MLLNTTLSFIGSGAMAEAMIKGILAEKLIDPDSIMASGPRASAARNCASVTASAQSRTTAPRRVTATSSC
jgi:pyrroline-5-carboxylate reductase